MAPKRRRPPSWPVRKDEKSLIDVIEHLSSGVSVIRGNPAPAEQPSAEQQPAESNSDEAISAKPPADPDPPADT
jgi:hypothetical protein